MDDTLAASLDRLTQLIHEGNGKVVVSRVFAGGGVGQTKNVWGGLVRKITNEDGAYETL